MSDVRAKFKSWLKKKREPDGQSPSKNMIGWTLTEDDAFEIWRAAWGHGRHAGIAWEAQKHELTDMMQPSEPPKPRGDLPGLCLDSGEFVPADKLPSK